MVLYGVDGELRLYRVAGLYPRDTWSGRRVAFTEPACRGGRLTVGLSSDPHLFARAQTVTAAGRSVQFEPSSSATLTVPLRPRGDGTCRVVFHVSPTAIPARVEQGSGDARRLGVHFTSFRLTAP